MDRSLVDAGYHAIVDDAPVPPNPHFQNDYAKLLADPTSVSVMLTVSKDAVRSRLVARSGPVDDGFLEHIDELSQAMEEGLEDPVWSDWTIIDTTDVAPSEVAALILELL